MTSHPRGSRPVWYACYGSNLSWERFRCYLEGGTPPGSTKENHPARDPSPPATDAGVELPFELYFAGRSTRWDGGVAFLDPSRLTHRPTLGRAWLITQEQFEDVVAQESGREVTPIDLDAVVRTGSTQAGPGWYDRVLLAGERSGLPVVTFSAPARRSDISAPSDRYLALIGAGLRVAHGLDDAALIDYLLARPGVSPHWNATTLHAAIAA